MDSRGKPAFEIYTNVRLKYEPNRGGLIVQAPLPALGTWKYQIQFSINDKQWVDEKDLELAIERSRGSRGELLSGGHEDLLLNLLLTKARDPLVDILYGLRASRTEFVVYQFKPVLKFLENPDQRLLIADEVGLGKTIEAGIIYQELQARTELKRVLVVCPAALTNKWQSELLNRFQEDFSILGVKEFRKFMDAYDKNGDRVELKGIISLEGIRRADIAGRIADGQYDFNLVIVDEAHHMRNRNTRSNDVGVILTDLAEAMLLLTATPLQTGNEDLFQLLHILAPGDFDDFSTFEDRIEPNKHINQASTHLSTGNYTAALKEILLLRKPEGAGRHLASNPNYIEAVNLLESIRASQSETKQEMVQAQKLLLNLNTLSHIFTRTRKREVDETAPIRRAHSLRVEFTEEERDFYETVIRHVKAEYRRHHGTRAGWAAITRERQAASSIQAMKSKYLQEPLSPQSLDIEERVLLQEWSQYSSDGEDYFDQGQQYFTPEEELLRAAKSLGDIDSKFDKFIQALEKLIYENPKRKILVFSYWLQTLDYLSRKLQQRGMLTLTISGKVPQEERNKILERFQFSADYNILISSEVGSEGLDFQFCDSIFNYDLPWNPMRVEQRIGRLDRYGQKAKAINIYNLVIEDSIEERIFLRLYERIEIFKQTIGDLEEILGEQISNITRIVYSGDLTKAEEEKLAETASQAIIRKKQEIEEFDKNRLQFMGQDAIFQERIEEKIRSGRYIAPSEVRALVNKFVTKNFKENLLSSNMDGGETFSLAVKSDLIEQYKAFIVRKKVSTSSVYQKFLDKLRYGSKVVPLTFSDQIATQRRPLEFVNLHHPLAEMALEFWLNQSREGLPIARLVFRGDFEFEGEFYYFLFKYSIATGSGKSIELHPIIVDAKSHEIRDEISEKFLPMLQQHSPEKHEFKEEFNEAAFDAALQIAETHGGNIQSELQLRARRDNEIMISSRLFNIEKTYEHRKRSLTRQLERVSDERIKRMKSSQLRTNEDRFLHRKSEIERQRDVFVTHSLELAGQFFVHYL